MHHNFKEGASVALRWLGIPVLIITIFTYILDARTRSYASRWESELSTEDMGAYTARYTYIGRDEILLQIHRTSDMALLAERHYDYTGSARLTWMPDLIMYDTNDSSLIHDGTISLPPSLLDRVLAHLP